MIGDSASTTVDTRLKKEVEYYPQLSRRRYDQSLSDHSVSNRIAILMATETETLESHQRDRPAVITRDARTCWIHTKGDFGPLKEIAAVYQMVRWLLHGPS
jgi:hypothetical protein